MAADGKLYQVKTYTSNNVSQSLVNGIYDYNNNYLLDYNLFQVLTNNLKNEAFFILKEV